MHCAGELDTNNRGDGASKVDAAAQDGVGSSTPDNAKAPGSTSEFDDAPQNTVGVTTSELYAAIRVKIQARSTRD